MTVSLRPLTHADGEHVVAINQAVVEMLAPLDEAGYRHARMSACGYSIGATYRPNWMDVPPMLYAGNPLSEL